MHAIPWPHGAPGHRRPAERRASRRCSTPSPAGRRSSRPTRSRPPRPTWASPRCADERLDALAEMSEVQEDRARDGRARRHRRAGRRGVRRARASATGSSPASARSTPCSSCCGRSRTTNVVGGTDPLDDLHTLELELVLADVASVEAQLDQRRKAAKERQVARGRGRGARGGARRCSTRARRSTARRSTPSNASRCGRSSSSRTSRCSRSSTSARTRSSDADDDREAGRRRARRRRRGARRERAARGGGGPARRRASAPSCSRASGSARARCPAWCAPPTTCSAGARSSPPATRSRARGRSAPAPRRPSARASSTPTCSGASSAPRSSAGTSCSSSARGRRPRTPGELRVEGKDYEVAGRRRARDPLQRLSATSVAWLVRDGEVLAALEVADVVRRARLRGLLGRDGVDGALLLRPGAVGAHARHALPDRRGLLRPRRSSCSPCGA